MHLPINHKPTKRTDGPGEGRLDGVDGLVEVIAIQAQTRLQTQRVSGTQTSRFHLGELEQSTMSQCNK